MSRFETAEFQAELKQAVIGAIMDVGLETFFATSLFGSNERKVDDV